MGIFKHARKHLGEQGDNFETFISRDYYLLLTTYYLPLTTLLKLTGIGLICLCVL